jgi:hypothetical protein
MTLTPRPWADTRARLPDGPAVTTITAAAPAINRAYGSVTRSATTTGYAGLDVHRAGTLDDTAPRNDDRVHNTR